MSKKAPTAPLCAHCRGPSQLVTGQDIYPHRPDLRSKRLWACHNCDAYVGCHGDTTQALGSPANAQLRDARIKLHNRMVDPLWKTAIESGGYTPEDNKARAIITKTARSRVYWYLAVHLGIERDQSHVAMFTLDQCRAAWRALQGKTYPEIRSWAKALKAQEAA